MQVIQTVAEALLPWATSSDTCPEIYCSSLATSIRCDDDPFHIRAYLAGFRLPAASLEELAASLDALEAEDELSAVWTTEGLLVRHASDGFFVLFVR